MKNNQPRRLHAALKSAFTLVELLVVIGIIALLIGILLPVLGKAREAANTAKCAANMRSATQALMLYTGAYHNWLPGPCTSGMIWPKSGNQMSTTDTSADTAPTQNMDWVSPTFGTMFRWPENDYERLKVMFNVQLSCPSNKRNFDSIVGLTGAPANTDLQSNSYSAVVQFHTFPRQERMANSVYPTISADMYATIGLTAPPDYTPQINHVGPPARKVYLVEGARYYDFTANGALSFNGYRYQKSGGNFMICGPFENALNTPYQVTTGAGQYTGNAPVNAVAYAGAWRHNKRMNLAFFDGHVEARTIMESIAVDLYTPPGTKIVDPSYTLDSTDKANQMVQ